MLWRNCRFQRCLLSLLSIGASK